MKASFAVVFSGLLGLGSVFPMGASAFQGPAQVMKTVRSNPAANLTIKHPTPVFNAQGLDVSIGIGIDGFWRWGSVRAAASDVERKARRLYRDARATEHHGDVWERRALRDLRELEWAAEHFYRQVSRYRNGAHHTRHDYQRLVRAHRDAGSSLRRAHAFNRVLNDYRRLDHSMRQLRMAYRFSPPRKHPRHPHPRPPHTAPHHPRHPGGGHDRGRHRRGGHNRGGHGRHH